MEYARVVAARVTLGCGLDVLGVGILYVWLENVLDIVVGAFVCCFNGYCGWESVRTSIKL